ncbi:RNA 2',3'-cyclic phosphodiesterase [Hydrogenobaculum acidophilum]
MRFFVGIFTTKKLEEHINRLKDELSDAILGKWVEPQNLHITLQFVGNVEEPKRVNLLYNLEEISENFSPFTVAYTGVGAFPNTSKPRILWIGISKGANSLKVLANKIVKANAKSGIEPESKPFYPHVSICRINEITSNKIYPFMRKHKDIFFLEEEINKIALVKSSLTSVGPIYTIVEEFYLKGSDIRT